MILLEMDQYTANQFRVSFHLILNVISLCTINCPQVYLCSDSVPKGVVRYVEFSN